MTRFLPAFALATAAALGSVAGGLLSSTSAVAQYDNPSMGDKPCVVLSRYVADEATGVRTADGAEMHRAEVGVENICGRSVEVSLCLGYAEPVDGVEESCSSGVLRPWSGTEIYTIEAPVQLAGPELEWRWLQGTTGDTSGTDM